MPITDEQHAANNRALEDRWAQAPWPYTFGCHMTYTGANQVITSGVATALTWDTVIYDDNKFWSGSGDARILKVPKGGAGVYVAYGYVLTDGAAIMAAPQVAIMRSHVGGTYAGVATFAPPGAITFMKLPLTCTVNLLEGDQLYFEVFHSAGANRNIVTFAADASTNAQSPQFSLWRVSVAG